MIDVEFCGTGIRPIPPRPHVLANLALLGGALRLDHAALRLR